MNQRLIVKLIFSSFFGSKIRIEETYKRICRFVYVNPKASRNLAVHSKGVLTLKEATDLMCMILLRIYMDIKKKMEPSGGENKESEKSDKPESSRKQNTVLSSIENISESGEYLYTRTRTQLFKNFYEIKLINFQIGRERKKPMLALLLHLPKEDVS